MELGLSLGDASNPFPSPFTNRPHDLHRQRPNGLGFSMGLSIGPSPIADDTGKSDDDCENGFPRTSSDKGSSEADSCGQMAAASEVPAEASSPNSGATSFQVKKMRLSKEQSAFLEESFKEHNTLNTVSSKQKAALAKRLNLRPRQVEIWFQNRRARTKLKQTEVECEYLKKCYDTLTEENRRLHNEVHHLKALNTSNPFHVKQPPATTLTMCPSCERVATNPMI